MRRAARLVTRAIAAVTGTVALARLGWPALGLVLVGIVIVAVVVCWVLASETRSRNAERLIRAAHPEQPLAPTPPTPALSSPPPITDKRWQARRRKGVSHG